MTKLISLVLTMFLISQTLFVPLSVSAQSPSSVFDYQYDNGGNLTYDGQRTITWDASGMPSSITKGNTVVNFIYDGGGQRIAKVVKDSNGNPISSTIYFGNIEKEIDYTTTPSITTITKYYFTGGKRIALRKQIVGNPNSELIYIHPDHLSSSTLFTDSSGGKKDALLTYYPYGSDRQNWDMPVPSTTPPATNHLYTNQIKDPETDLYYYNARYYNPQTGSFISADTAGDKLNKYAYASNNPVMFSDPTGHMETDPNLGLLASGNPEGNKPTSPGIEDRLWYLSKMLIPDIEETYGIKIRGQNAHWSANDLYTLTSVLDVYDAEAYKGLTFVRWRRIPMPVMGEYDWEAKEVYIKGMFEQSNYKEILTNYPSLSSQYDRNQVAKLPEMVISHEIAEHILIQNKNYKGIVNDFENEMARYSVMWYHGLQAERLQKQRPKADNIVYFTNVYFQFTAVTYSNYLLEQGSETSAKEALADYVGLYYLSGGKNLQSIDGAYIYPYDFLYNLDRSLRRVKNIGPRREF